jgi:hypothetical protein
MDRSEARERIGCVENTHLIRKKYERPALKQRPLNRSVSSGASGQDDIFGNAGEQ